MISINQFIIDNIFKYDSPYHNLYQLCLSELKIIIKKYNMISTTYSIVRDDQTLFFKNYDENFLRFYLIQIHNY